jgi:histidine triad (HIT) family protein
MNECIFDKIIKGEIPSKKVWENDSVLAFFDINPEAPIHVLIIPKKHISSLAEASSSDKDLLGEMLLAVVEVAKVLNVDKTGFRLILNNGPDSGQIVPHIHFHLLAGKKLKSKLVN